MLNSTKQVAIVIPVYKEVMNNFEIISFKRCLEVFCDYDIILAAPADLNLSVYYEYSDKITEIRFEAEYFKSIASYNKLMMSDGFYEKFLTYQYILIYQLDAFIFKNNLEAWISQNYDYIGAPWVDGEWIIKLKSKLRLPVDKLINKVGNGGLSLRKVRKFYTIAKWLRPIAFFWKYNEDFFWSTFVYRIWPRFTIPSQEEALGFAFEDNPSKSFELNHNQLPFGCHAWEKYDLTFWRPYFKSYGYSI